MPFDEGSGSTAYDQSLYGNDGTIYNGVWTRGRYGHAISFNGDGRVQATLATNPFADSYTVVFWINQNHEPDETSDPRGIFDAVYSGTYLRLFSHGWFSGHWSIEWDKVPGEIGNYVILSPSYDWVQIAVVYEHGVRAAIYLNGEKKLEDTTPADMRLSDMDYIRISAPHRKYSIADFDEFRIYSRALSDEEIRELYEGKPTLRVDRNGNLSALLYGKVGNVFKPVELDSLSNLRINIEAQTLSELSTGVRTYQAESAEWISADQTASLASNAN
ncbi:MAG: LamG domain-containing protein, partial [Deltaproteobacteria bacterium]|nr:LamG domain-containing protein [Deltaproteobacteria bacterium]